MFFSETNLLSVSVELELRSLWYRLAARVFLLRWTVLLLLAFVRLLLLLDRSVVSSWWLWWWWLLWWWWCPDEELFFSSCVDILRLFWTCNSRESFSARFALFKILDFLFAVAAVVEGLVLLLAMVAMAVLGVVLELVEVPFAVAIAAVVATAELDM